MLYVWLTMLVILNTCWLCLVIFSLPGNWLMVISTGLFAWWRWDDGVFSVYTIIVIAVLALIAELIEFFAGMGGAKKAGAGLRGMIGVLAGAVTGALLGTFLIPVLVLGTLIGACVGAALGTWLLELSAGRKMKKSVRSGLGAGAGVLFGLTSKFAIGIFIWLIIAIAAFWP